MTKTIHLIVIKGKDKSKQISIPVEGARLGRSSKNDVVIVDPLLSRHHCRLYFKQGDGLWITDLGSANNTILNNKPIHESRLRTGDNLKVGDTVIKVVNDGLTSLAISSLTESTDSKNSSIKKQSNNKQRIGLLLLVVCLASATLTAISLPRLCNIFKTTSSGINHEPGKTIQTIEIDYEYVKASPENIYRYKLNISKNNILSIKIDDLKNNNHNIKKQHLTDKNIQNLILFINNSEFFTLKKEYHHPKANLYISRDLSVTIDKKTHRTKILNNEEPKTFHEIRIKLEKLAEDEIRL